MLAWRLNYASSRMLLLLYVNIINTTIFTAAITLNIQEWGGGGAGDIFVLNVLLSIIPAVETVNNICFGYSYI